MSAGIVSEVATSQPAATAAKKKSCLKRAAIAVGILMFGVYLFRFRLLRSGLKRKGWKLYSKAGCPACDAQLDLLGGEYDPAVECADGAADCASIAVYPTWVNTKTGESRGGVQSYNELRKML